MNSTKQHIKPKSKFLIIAGWCVLGLLVLAALLRLSLKTSLVHNFAKNKIVELANRQLNASLNIDKLEGDLWKEVRLRGVLLADPDTVVYVDSAFAAYNVMSLAKDVFLIHKLSLEGVKANIVETDSAVFNVMKLLKPGDEPSEPSSSFYFDLQSLLIHNLNTEIRSFSYLPDNRLAIRNLDLDASLKMTEAIEASLSRLDFTIKEGRLPGEIRVNTSASYADDRITLQKLVLQTGRSLLEAKAAADTDLAQLQGEVDLQPFSTADLIPYLDAVVPDDQIQMILKAEGIKSNLKVGLSLHSRNIEEFNATAKLDLTGIPAVNAVDVSGKKLNFSGFLPEETAAEIGFVSLSLNGNLSERLSQTALDWRLNLNDLRYDAYHINTLAAEGVLADNNLNGTITLANESNGIIHLVPDIIGVFTDLPDWRLKMNSENLNLRGWKDDLDLTTNLNWAAAVSGKGFALSEQNFNYRIELNSEKSLNHINNIALKAFEAAGNINESRLNLNGLARTTSGEINFNLDAEEYLTERPAYGYSLNARDLDLSDFTASDEMKTTLNFAINGTGSGFDLETMELDGELAGERGFINNALINRAGFKYKLQNGFLTLADGLLLSEITDATFGLRQNLNNTSDLNNRLDFDFTLKEMQPFAPLFGAEVFNATGNIKGGAIRGDDGILQYRTRLALEDVQLDDRFHVELIGGDANVTLGLSPAFDTAISLSGLLIYGASMQDIEFLTSAELNNEVLTGDYTFIVTGSERGQLQQKGSYESRFADNSHNLKITQFDIISTNNLLAMQQPFHLQFENGSFKTDTLSLSADDGAFFTLSVPYADSTRQEVWLQGLHFDLGIMQDILFDARFSDGIISGNLNLLQDDTDLKAQGELLLEALDYKETVADSVVLRFEVADKRLTADGFINLDKRRILVGELNVPFIPVDSKTLSDSFFEEPVQGELRIESTELSDFKSILDAFNINDTEGLLSFNGSLSGVAGNPEIDGRLTLARPILSGISMDSIFVQFNYNNNLDRFYVGTEVQAGKQKAFIADIEIPFSYDFKTFEVKQAPENEQLIASLKTDNFNLTALNDFLNKTYTRNLKGILNGDLTLQGKDDDFSLEGSLNLSKASIEIPIANITLNDVKSDFFFEKEKIRIEGLQAKSGRGVFEASGAVMLDGMSPSSVDIQASARQFRLINTKDYNMTIDLDSKLEGRATAPKLTGKLAVKNGFFYLSDFGDKYVEDVQLEGEENSFSPYDSLALGMQFVIERDFYIRNRRYLDLEVELTGNLDAVKETGGDLNLFGNLEGVKGYVKPLGKLFNLDEANLVFSGPMTDPEFNIKSSYRPNQNQDPVTLYYIIEGTATNPKFRFDSDPPMEQQDIISYTLFGRPFYALDSWERTVSSGNTNVASDILMNILMDEVESLATRELGIDVVQIESIRSGTETGTSIKTGWYVNNRTFFAIINEIGNSNPKTLFLLEYMLTKNVDLILTQGDNARQGIDVRWKLDY